MRFSVRSLIAALTLVVTVSTAFSAPPAAAAPTTVPVTVTNDAGIADTLHLSIIGTDLATGRLGYVDAAGAFHPWNLPSGPGEIAAPDVSIDGPAAGRSATIQVPRGVSARVYYSYGAAVPFRLVSGGLVQPAPWNASDPTAGLLFDWAELTFDSNGLWLNSTQVDQFALPATLSTTSTDGTQRSTGALGAGGRQSVIDALAADPAYARSIVREADGTVLRVLAPTHAVGAGLMAANLLDAAIASAWAAYGTRTLTVAPFESTATTYSGRSIDGQLVFTDATGRRVAAFARPSTSDVLGCDGALHAPNDQVVGPIARTLCAALQRGNLVTVDVQPAAPDTYYADGTGNRYSGAVHAAMADGRAYGFAFDDVASQESLIHDPAPVAAALRIQPIGVSSTASPATPSPTASPSPIASPSPTATPTPAASTTPTSTPSGTPTTVASTWTAAVTIPQNQRGYAELVLDSGTQPGLVTLEVRGGARSTVAVSGPTIVRIDLSAAPGAATLTLTGSAPLGSPQIRLPEVYAFTAAG